MTDSDRWTETDNRSGQIPPWHGHASWRSVHQNNSKVLPFKSPTLSQSVLELLDVVLVAWTARQSRRTGTSAVEPHWRTSSPRPCSSRCSRGPAGCCRWAMLRGFSHSFRFHRNCKTIFIFSWEPALWTLMSQERVLLKLLLKKKHWHFQLYSDFWA